MRNLGISLGECVREEEVSFSSTQLARRLESVVRHVYNDSVALVLVAARKVSDALGKALRAKTLL